MRRSRWLWAGMILCQAGIAHASDRMTVKQFRVVGSTVFQDWEFANVTQPYEDKLLTLDEVQKAAEAVTRYYLDHGYLTSRAVLGNQTIENGIVYIQVIEGRLANVQIQGNRRISDRYLRDRIQRASLAPLNQEDLENHLRLLRSDPLLSHIDASLKEREDNRESTLTVNVTEANPRMATVGLDNDSPESIGRIKLSAIAGTRNLTGNGDVLLVSHARTQTGGASLWNLSYQRILDAKQGTVSFRVSPNQYRITQPELRDLNITGSSQLYEISVRQPLSRQIDREFALSLGIVHRTGETIISDFLTSSEQSTAFRFGQDYLRRDRAGTWLGQSQITASPEFVTWTGQLQRLQILSKNHTVIAELGWQLSPDQLPAAQQFNLGGTQSLRGYPQGSFSGDNGITVTLASQFTLGRNVVGEPTFQLSPFLDAGTLWNTSKNPVQAVNRSLLFSTGLSLTWKPTSKWTVRMDAAFPLSTIDQATALYFNSIYQF